MRLVLLVVFAVSGWSWGEVSLGSFSSEPAFKTASIGVYAVPLEGDESLASYQEDVALIPASTMKAVTTAAALQILGPDYQFETRIYLKGEDVVILGGGDPTLSASSPTAEFPAWLTALREAGLEEIKGDLIVDASRFESRTTPDNWPWGDVGNYYGAGPSGLNYHLNLFTLTFKPGRVGGPAKLVSTKPRPPDVLFENHMRTGSAGSGDQGYVYGGPGALRMAMRGTIPAGGNFSIKGALPNPPQSCLEAFRSYLKGQKFPFEGRLRVGSPILDEAELIYTGKSPSLAKIIKGTNHRSVNLYADSVFKAVTERGTTKAAVVKIRDLWKKEGMDLTGFVMEDGSGLSPRNAITARQLALMMKAARGHETGEVFLQSLPTVGRTGTVKYLGRGSAIQGKVRAKSGSLTRVQTYAGYLAGKSGKKYAFAILTNNAVSNPKPAIVRLLEKLVREG